MGDKSLFYKYVRIELFKQRRLKDMLRVVDGGGYGFSLNEDKTKVLLWVTGRNFTSSKGLKLEVGINHKHLGYDLLSAMHNRRIYEPFNDKNEYKVVHITSDSKTGYVEFITSNLPAQGDNNLYNPIDVRNSPKLELLLKEFTNLNTAIVKHKFKNHEEFRQFYLEGFLILEDNFDYKGLEIKKLRKVEDEVRVINGRISKLEKDKEELNIKKEQLKGKLEGEYFGSN